MDTANETQPTRATKSGETLEFWPGTENPVSIDEAIRRRDELYEQYKHLLKNYSVEQYLREKHRDVEMGIA